MSRCLVVDDSSIVRKVLRAILEDLRYEVAEAENGQEAIEQCQTLAPDLIILDWHMPGMGTLEILSDLRTKLTGSRPRILYMMTELDVADMARALGAGADDYLMKPFDRSMIEAKLADLYALV